MPTSFGNTPRENIRRGPAEQPLGPDALGELDKNTAIAHLTEGRDLAQNKEALKAKLKAQYEQDKADFGMNLLAKSETARREAVSAIALNNQELRTIDNAEAQEIFNALDVEIPQSTQEDVTTRYISHNKKGEVNGFPEYTYGINFQQVYADIDLLKAYVSTYPQVQTVIDALMKIAEADKRHMIYLHNTNKANNYTDNAVLYMGKILSFGTFGALAFLMGTHAYLAKGSYVPTAIYATIAALHLPQFREMFFPGKKEAKIAKEIDAVLNEPIFMDLSEQYGVQGMAWKNLAMLIMNDPDGSKESLKTLIDSNTSATEKKTTINRFIGLMGNDGEAIKNLTHMIQDDRFGDFVSVLLQANDDSAKETVAKFIEKGMWQHAKGDVRTLVQKEETSLSLNALKVKTANLPTQLPS